MGKPLTEFSPLLDTMSDAEIADAAGDGVTEADVAKLRAQTKKGAKPARATAAVAPPPDPGPEPVDPNAPRSLHGQPHPRALKMMRSFTDKKTIIINGKPVPLHFGDIITKESHPGVIEHFYSAGVTLPADPAKWPFKVHRQD